MLVNTSFVVDEISKDRKGGLSGSIGHQFDHDVFFILIYGICLLAMAQIILIFFVVFFVFAIVVAFWGSAILFTGSAGTIHMMFAWFESVGLATIIGTIKAPSHKSFPVPVAPGSARESTIATKTAGKSNMPTSSRVKHELEEDPDCQVCECKFGPTLLKQLQMPSMSHILPGPKSY